MWYVKYSWTERYDVWSSSRMGFPELSLWTSVYALEALLDVLQYKLNLWVAAVSGLSIDRNWLPRKLIFCDWDGRPAGCSFLAEVVENRPYSLWMRSYASSSQLNRRESLGVQVLWWLALAWVTNTFLGRISTSDSGSQERSCFSVFIEVCAYQILSDGDGLSIFGFLKCGNRFSRVWKGGKVDVKHPYNGSLDPPLVVVEGGQTRRDCRYHGVSPKDFVIVVSRPWRNLLVGMQLYVSRTVKWKVGLKNFWRNGFSR